LGGSPEGGRLAVARPVGMGVSECVGWNAGAYPLCNLVAG